MRQRIGSCRCGDYNDVGSIPKSAGLIDGLLVEHRLLFVVSTYLVRGPKENIIQHHAIVRRPMARRRLQQPSNSRPAVHSCIATLNASRSWFTPKRLAGRLWPSNATLDAGGELCVLQQAQHQQNPIEQPGGPLWSWNRLPELIFKLIDHHADALATGYDEPGPIYIGAIKIDFLALRHVICRQFIWRSIFSIEISTIAIENRFRTGPMARINAAITSETRPFSSR